MNMLIINTRFCKILCLNMMEELVSAGTVHICTCECVTIRLSNVNTGIHSTVFLTSTETQERNIPVWGSDSKEFLCSYGCSLSIVSINTINWMLNINSSIYPHGILKVNLTPIKNKPSSQWQRNTESLSFKYIGLTFLTLCRFKEKNL